MGENELKKTCLCGVHVHTATTASMWLQMTICLLFGIGVLYFLPIAIINILFCLMVLYGLHAKRPAFYVPFLILSIISVFLEVIAFISLMVKLSNNGEKLLASIIYIGIFAFFAYWFIVIPYYSYKLLKFEVQEEQKQNNSETNKV